MTNTFKTALLIINPNARQGGDADLQEGMTLLEQAGMTVTREDSDSAQRTAELIEQYRAKVDLVIIGGGDGTISSAAEALYSHKVTFAILPLGTANDLARSLGMTGNLLEAFRNILDNKIHRVNLGVINGKYFFNAANIGLGVKVTHALTPEVKKRWGVLSYLKAVFVALRNNQTFRARITIDGVQHHLYSIQIAVGNGRYYGGGNVIDERSTIDDGKLSLYSLPPLSLWELLTLGPLLRNGKQRQAAQTFSGSGHEIEIVTHPVREIHADGEPVGKTPGMFKVIPEALAVICPEPLHPDN